MKDLIKDLPKFIDTCQVDFIKQQGLWDDYLIFVGTKSLEIAKNKINEDEYIKSVIKF